MSGWVDFEANLEKAGGIANLARENYSRNLWAIMSKFNVLPTDERFLNLNTIQINFLLESMEIDNLIASGKDINSVITDDSFNYEGDMDMPDESEQEDTWKQLLEMKPKHIQEEEALKLDRFTKQEAAGEDSPELKNLKAERQRRLAALGLIDDPLLDDEEDVDTL